MTKNLKNFFLTTIYTIINLLKLLFLTTLQMAIVLMLYDCKIIKANMFTVFFIFALMAMNILIFVKLCEKK